MVTADCFASSDEEDGTDDKPAVVVAADCTDSGTFVAEASSTPLVIINEASSGDVGKSPSDSGALDLVNRKDVEEETELLPPPVNERLMTVDDVFNASSPSRLHCS